MQHVVCVCVCVYVCVYVRVCVFVPVAVCRVCVMAALLVLVTGVQVLLSRDEVLQLSGAQCVVEVLVHHSHYTQALLKADIAGQWLAV